MRSDVQIQSTTSVNKRIALEIVCDRVLIPAELGSKVLSVMRDNHPDIVAMNTLATSLIYYPELDKDIHSLVLDYKICQSVRTESATSDVTVPIPLKPWSA